MIELRPAKYLLGRLAPMDNNDKIPQFNLGAGTYDSTVYLRGDGVWADPLAGAGFVPLTRELTINGVTYDLSANRTWIIDKVSVGLGNVDNTSDANKPISTATQTALNAKENTSNKGIPGGYASLAGDGKVPSDQLPSYVDDVIEVANYAALPTVGETGVIYITLDNNNVYRWAGSVYVQISQPNAVWGSITGTLSSQTDLQTTLNAKQDDITLTTTGNSGAATFIGNTLNIPQYSQDLSGYVPYVGATTDVNLGNYDMYSSKYWLYDGPNDNYGSIHFTDGNFHIEDGDGHNLFVVEDGFVQIHKTNTIQSNLYTSGLTAIRDHYLPDASGTIALTSQLHNAVTLGTANGLSLINQVLSLGLSSDSSNGALSSSNWITFNSKQNAITLTTAGSSGAATFIGSTLNIPQYFQDLSGYVPTSRTITINGTNQDLSANRSWTIDKVSVGLGNVDNTSDLNKPISTATQTALNAKQDSATAINTGNIAFQSVAFAANAGLLDGYDSTYFYPSSNPNGYTNNVGTVTSVGVSAPTGFSVSNSPVTNSGTIGISFASGYSLPTNASQSNWNEAYNDKINSVSVTGTTVKLLTLTQQDGGTLTTSWTDINTDAVSSVFGRTGAVVSVSGDYNTSQVTENTNLYYTEARVNANSNVAANTAARHNAVTLGTANGLNLSTQQLSLGLSSGSTTGALSSTDWNTFNNKQNALTNPVTGAGTTNRVPKFTGATTIGDSQIFDNGTNVGIGTASPGIYPYAAEFNVNGSISSSSGKIGWGVTDAFTSYGYSAAQYGISYNLASASPITVSGYYGIGFFSDFSERMRVAFNGNIGIGTTSPNAKLDVIGEIRLGDFSYNSTLNQADIAKITSTFTDQSNVQFYGHTGGASNNLIMTLRGAGNVGIGTTTPAYKLDVNGRALVDQFQYTKAIDYSGGDLNSLTTAGFYDGSNMANAPEGNTGWFYITVERHNWGPSADWVHQTATSFGSGNTANLVYTRTKTGGTWQNWRRFIDWTDVNGTTNYVSKFTSNNSIGNSLIYDNGTNVGINTTSPGYPLHLYKASSETGILTSFGSADVYLSHGGWGMGANKFGIGNATSPSIVVNGSNDNVGVGTKNPIWKFVVSNGGAAGLEIDPDNGIPGRIGLYAYNRATSNYFPISFQASSYNFDIGNVGIGTTNPSSKLTVNGTASITDGSSSITFGQWDGSTNRIEFANRPLRFAGYWGNSDIIFANNSDQERMRIITTGNVGIGTSNPLHKLEVAGNISINGGNFLDFNNGDVRLSNSGGVFTINTYSVSTGLSEKVRVTGVGNVGIGTTTPAQKLEITSNNRSLLKLYNTDFDYGANQSKIDFFGKWWSGDPNNENLHASIVGEHGTGDGFRRGILRFYVNADGTIINPMMINYNGNVGIGTTNPGTALEVNGNVGIGIGGTIEPSAALEVKSNTQGFLPPRMSDSEMYAISSPVDGLIIWNYDSSCLFVFAGGSWRKIAYA